MTGMGFWPVPVNKEEEKKIGNTAVVRFLGTYDNVDKIKLTILNNNKDVLLNKLFLQKDGMTSDEVTDKIIEICTKYKVKEISQLGRPE